MTPADRDLLAADLCVTAGLSPAAARLLLRLAEDGPVEAASLTGADDRRGLAALRACDAAEVDGARVRHRPASWRVRRLAVRSTRLCVQTCGEGEALVLAPPFGTYRCLWGTPWARGARQLGPFSRRYRTISVDYRGTGCSDIGAAPYSLEGCAADLHAVLDRLRVERAHLLGVSIGGGVVLRMALMRPERIASLVLCGTNASAIDAATRAKAETFLSLARDRPLEWALRAYLRTPLAAATPRTVDALVALGRRSVRTLANFLNLYRANIFRSDVRDRLGEIRVPTLVLVGERDVAYFQEEARMLASGIAGAALVSVPAAGHVVCEHNPRAFNRVVLDFLARHPIGGLSVANGEAAHGEAAPPARVAGAEA